MTADTLTLPLVDDLHVHLRQGPLMRQVVPRLRQGGAGRVLVMPNLDPPVATVGTALDYRGALTAIDPNVEYLMTLFLTPVLGPDEVNRAADARISAVKSYPRGVTTGSGEGVEGSLEPFYPAFAVMEEVGLVLSLHGEVPSDVAQNVCILNAEERFLVHLENLHRAFPRLRIVLEHVTTEAAVNCVRRLGDTVAATITPHHLELTVDDWAGRNHNFCKPVAKYPRDREALRRAVMEGHPRFFLGSDSAPHPRRDKEGASACAGVYTSPLLLPYLATTFEALGCLERLRDFTSSFGAAFYGLEPQTATVTLARKSQTVPGQIDDVVPFRAGDSLTWSIAA